jgi:hypothetical protein
VLSHHLAKENTGYSDEIKGYRKKINVQPYQGGVMAMRFKMCGYWCAAALFLIVTTGCAKAPEQKLKMAKSACSSAMAVEADQYASDEYEEADQLLNEAIKEMKQENKIFFLFRNYKDVEKKLDEVVVLANNAKESAKLEKERIELAAQMAAEKEKEKKMAEEKAKKPVKSRKKK